MASNVSNLVRSNVVSQVPYFITYSFTGGTTTKPLVELTETWRYYNNQTVALPLYGATNINATYNGAQASWNYKSIELTATPAVSTDKMTITCTGGDEALFTAGVYFQHKTSGEIILVEKVDTTAHTVQMRRGMFNTTAATFAADDIFYQMNAIEITPAGYTTGNLPAGTGTIWANPMMGPSQTGYYKA